MHFRDINVITRLINKLYPLTSYESLRGGKYRSRRMLIFVLYTGGIRDYAMAPLEIKLYLLFFPLLAFPGACLFLTSSSASINLLKQDSVIHSVSHSWIIKVIPQWDKCTWAGDQEKMYCFLKLMVIHFNIFFSPSLFCFGTVRECSLNVL